FRTLPVAPVMDDGPGSFGRQTLGGNGLIVQADLSRPDGVLTLWRDALAAAGRIHAVVNNAGVRKEISIDADPSDWRAAWQKEFQVN
ncbi:hypothetical protein AB9E26_36035, partial [Rhizobium leguminosarum]